MMNEESLLIDIAHNKSMIELETAAYRDKVKPYESKLHDLTETYSRLFSPLSVGDEIEYSPSDRDTGIVRIEKANCLDIPDQWEYQIRVLSIMKGSEKNAIGNILWVKINRSSTPKKLN